MKQFLLRWFVTVAAVAIASAVVSGIEYDRFSDLLVAGLLLGFLNAFVKPVLMLLSFPFLIVTLGLFTLVINALMLYWVGHLMHSFRVASFGAAFWGGLVISIASTFLNSMIGTNKSPPGPPPPPAGGSGNGKIASDGGPIIDV